MYYWKTSTNVKKIQRSVNKEARHLNQTLEEDPLFKGRFYIHQLERVVHRYDGELYCSFLFEFVDRETGKFAHYWFNDTDFNGISKWRVWEKMNFFITEYVDFWGAKPRPTRETTIDYRKRK